LSLSPPIPQSDPARLAKTGGYYLTFIAFGMAAAALGPALPALAANSNSSLSQISILFTATSLGFILGSLIGGRLYDRHPGHIVMVAALLAMAMVALLAPLTPLVWLLALLWLTMGTALGTLELGTNTLLIWIHRHNLGPWMNGLHLFFGIGAFLSPLIITQTLARTGQLTWAFWILALLILLPALWLIRLPSPLSPVASVDSPEAKAPIGLLLAITLLFVLYVGAEVSFGGWIFSYTEALHGDATLAGLLTSAFWGALTVGRLVAIPISARLRPRLILAINYLGCISGVTLLLLWPTSSTGLWLGTMLTGVSMASVFPTLLTFAERRIVINGTVNTWFFAGSGLGGMLVPWGIGQVFESAGPQSTMLIILGVVLAGLAIFMGIVFLVGGRAESSL
jgi:FHS family Na+ dependent glucose MFS transporter 1